MRIAIHPFGGITAFHLAAPLLAFGEVSRQTLANGWRTTVWSSDGRPVRADEGVVIDDLSGPDATTSADLLVFPSWPAHLPAPEPDFIDRIRAAHVRGATIIGLCLGAFPVAASGVLDGRTATTHWAPPPNWPNSTRPCRSRPMRSTSITETCSPRQAPRPRSTPAST